MNLQNIDEFIFDLLEKTELSFTINLFQKIYQAKSFIKNFQIDLIFVHLEKTKKTKNFLENKEKEFFFNNFSVKNISQNIIKPVIYLYNKEERILVFLNDIRDCLNKEILFQIKTENRSKNIKNQIAEFIKSNF